jgi:ribonuclease D
LIALANSKVLDGLLCHVFLTSTIVGFSFDSDLDMLEKHCPKLHFYREIKKLLDIQVYYMAVKGTEKRNGLAKVATELLGKEICKAERMSNWERRPLRMS